MSLDFAIEKLAPIWPQILFMASEHWKETEGYRHGQEFAPDAYRYFQFNELPGVGNMAFYTMFTARDGGRLVGYAGCYVTRSMHSQIPICTEDTYFLLPTHRKGRNALEFYKFIEAACVANGIEEMGMTSKKVNGVGRILKYLGFESTSENHTKQLRAGLADAA